MYKTIKQLIGTKFPPNYLSRGDQQDIESIILEASEQAFDAGRTVNSDNSANDNEQVLKPKFAKFTDFTAYKFDKL